MKQLLKFAVAAIAAVAAVLGTYAQPSALTYQQAVQLVKTQRTDSANLAADFYAATITDFVHDGISPVDSLNIPSWVMGDSQKMLVFVDEYPGARWTHPCTYYYVTGNLNNAQVHAIGGLRPPFINLIPMDVQVSESDYAHLPNHPDMSHVPGQCVYETGTHVLLLVDLLNGGSYKKSNTQSWNECAALYDLLVNRYRIPKANVHVFMGTAEYGEDEFGYWVPTDTIMFDDNGNPVPLLRDLDGDGENDVQFTSDLGAYEDYCTAMASTLDEGDIEHLFFCYIGNSNIYPADNGDEAQTNTGIFAGELNMAFWLKAQKQSFMFACPYASKFMRHISHRDNVVLMGTQYAFDSDFEATIHGEDLFFIYWLNALAGYYVTAPLLPADADYNKDGYVSFYEAFAFAHYKHSDGGASYESIPGSLIKELSFDMNSRTELKVHQGESYNSPDIWMRNDSDGFVNQAQGRIYVSENSRTKYIYVRVHNDGNNTYSEGNRYLYLYWQKPRMGMDFHLPSSGYNDYGGLIDWVTVTDSIMSGSSKIMQYQWYIPDSLVAFAQANGGLLPITLIAQVYAEDGGNILTPVDYAKSTKVVFNPEKGKRVDQLNGFTLTRYQEHIVPITFDQGISSISVPWQDGNYDMFGNLNIDLSFSQGSPVSEMSYDSNYFAVSGNGSQRLRILSSGGQISNIPTTGTNMVDFDCRRYGNQFQSHPYLNEAFGLEFYDDRMNLVDGIDFVCEMDSVDVSQPIIDPGIVVHGMPGGGYLLTAQNVNTNDELSWYDNNQNDMGHNGQVEIMRDNASGTITLEVCRGGENMYASVSLDNVVRISDVTMSDGSIRVSLTAPACSGYRILVNSTLQPALNRLLLVDSGATEVVFAAPEVIGSPFVVTLLEGETVVDSKQIMQ